MTAGDLWSIQRRFDVVLMDDRVTPQQALDAVLRSDLKSFTRSNAIGRDGVPTFSVAHPMAPSGRLQSNLSHVRWSPQQHAAVLLAGASLCDIYGEPHMIAYDVLVVHPSLYCAVHDNAQALVDMRVVTSDQRLPLDGYLYLDTSKGVVPFGGSSPRLGHVWQLAFLGWPDDRPMLNGKPVGPSDFSRWDLPSNAKESEGP